MIDKLEKQREKEIIMKRKGNVVLFLITLLMLAAMVSVQSVFAQPPTGAIWTTTGSCGDPQNVNHYTTGDHVYINGANFAPGDYAWDITGQPGGASNHPNIVVASGNITVDQSGAFCFMAYIIGPTDGGTYRANLGGKNDNYRVDQQEQEPTPVPTQEPTPDDPGSDPTPQPTPAPTQVIAGTPAQATPAPVVAPTTGAPSGPAALIISAASAIGLSGLSLGAWIKRRKQ
jgi:hypothetical protein